MIAPGLCQTYPGQGDVLKLAQVAEVVIGRQSLLTRPAEGFPQPTLHDPYSYFQCLDRADVGGKISVIQVLCLVEQFTCTDQISPGLLNSSHRHAPAIRVFR